MHVEYDRFERYMMTYHKIDAIFPAVPGLIELNHHEGHRNRVPFVWGRMREAFLPVDHEPDSESRLRAPQDAQRNNGYEP